MSARARAARLKGRLAAAALIAASGHAAAQAPATPAPGAAAPKPGEGAGDKVDAARQRFRRGLELTAAGRLAEALAEFQAAYDLSPTYRILYNIGQVSRHV